MLPPDEVRWMRSTATELGNLLKVLQEAEDYLHTVVAETADTHKQFDILRTGLQRASQIAQALTERAQKYAAAPGTGGTPQSFDSPAAATPKELAHLVAAVEAVEAEPPAPAPVRARETVLVVDDEEFVTMLAKRVLTDEGYRVFTAKDGFECLERYRQLRGEIDLIILDFTMPIMDGGEVFDELRAINPRVSVMLSSGFAEQDRLRGMLAKGLRGFIPKPYTQQKLVQQVRSTLDSLKSEAD